MSLQATADPMAKRDDVVVKVDRAVVRKAKLIAEYNGQHLAEYLSMKLRPIVEDEYPKVARLMLDEGKAELPKKPKGTPR